jgi:hypothetical protein
MCKMYIFLTLLTILIMSVVFLYKERNNKNKESYCSCGDRFSFPYEESANLPGQGLGAGNGRYPTCMCQ